LFPEELNFLNSIINEKKQTLLNLNEEYAQEIQDLDRQVENKLVGFKKQNLVRNDNVFISSE